MDTATYAAAAALPWSVIQRLKRPCGPQAGISAIQTAIEQKSEAFRKNWREHEVVPNRTPTVLRASQQNQMKRDLTVSRFVLALVLVGVILAANTEQSVFWLLIGPAPIAVLHTSGTFLRQVLDCRFNVLSFYRCFTVIVYRGAIKANSWNKNRRALNEESGDDIR